MATKKSSNQVTGWVGWVFFAGMLMIMQGFFNGVAGLTALFNDQWIAVTEDQLLFYDLTAWGWWHLLVGALLVFAGLAIMEGKTWARFVGVLTALASAVAALNTVEAYPWWSVIIIVLDVLIIYAITVHGHELEQD